MNVFFLADTPDEAALYHCDKHVIKMVLESAQLLRMLDLDPEQYRTDGGRLNLLRVRAALADRTPPNAKLTGLQRAAHQNTEGQDHG